jgi:hypothetical protein
MIVTNGWPLQAMKWVMWEIDAERRDRGNFQEGKMERRVGRCGCM